MIFRDSLHRISSIVLLLAVALIISSCGERPAQVPGDERSQAELALEEIKELYDKAMQEAPEDPVEWAKDDFAKFGDWEYQVVLIDDAGVEEKLNELGTERWEAFWIERESAGLRVYLKRPARSYLRSVPLSGLGKILGVGGEESAE